MDYSKRTVSAGSFSTIERKCQIFSHKKYQKNPILAQALNPKIFFKFVFVRKM